MPNAFSKEEIVQYEELLEGFDDQLVLSRNVNMYKTSPLIMERANYTIWRPMPFIGLAYDGLDQTGNFPDMTQLSVPAQINIFKSDNWKMSPLDLNDALQENRLFDSAKQKLASAINVALMNLAATKGTLVVKRTSAASGFDDIAQCEAVMNEQGVNYDNRFIALSTRDYNGMASNLAGRSWVDGPVRTAYERAILPKDTGSFMPFKLDYANRLSAATASSVTINGANQYYTPLSTRTAATGETSNVDNRYQNIDVTVGSGTISVGDCITIAGVNSVHHITKEDTGQLKTFRVTAIISGAGSTGTIQISPPIISNGGGTAAEQQYKNVTATPANGAAVTFLNTTTAYVNPFWKKDSMEILPGSYTIPTNAGAEVLSGSTPSGIPIKITKQFDINTMTTKYRVDTFFGVNMNNPEMAGIILFNQA